MLHYDSQGFILGIHRVERQTKVVHDDTQKIIEILSHGGKKRQQQLQQTGKIIQQVNQNNKPLSNNNRHASPKANRNRLAQQRVSIQQTRFRRSDNPNNQQSDSQFAKADKERQFFLRLNHELKHQLENEIDSQQLDPLLDSVNEVKGVLSPMGKVFGLMFKAGAWKKNKIFANKKREPLSNAEQRHQTHVEEQLERIENNRSGGFRLNPFMKMFGKIGKMLWGGLAGVGVFALKHSKYLLKKLGGIRALGALGAFFGTGSLAMDWSNLSDKEKSRGIGGLLGGFGGASIGALIGSAIFPGVGTAIGAVVGGWLGGRGGSVIGEYTLPHIRNWVDSLISFDLPKQLLEKFSNGLSDLFKGSKNALLWVYDSFLSVVDRVKQKINEWVETAQGFLGGIADGASSLWSDVKNALGVGGDFIPASKAVDVAKYASEHALKKSIGYCALYINNAFRAMGFKASGHGVDVADNLYKLNKGKFEYVQYSKDYVPQIGDVMSMKSHSQSGHNYGHVAIYTEQGWVSDFKQGNKYGNTGAANQDYFKEIQSGKIKPTIVRMVGGKSLDDPNKQSIANLASNTSIGGNYHEGVYKSTGIKYYKYDTINEKDLVARGNQKIHKTSANAFDQMAKDFKQATGMSLAVQSGYRSVDYQQGIINRKKAKGMSDKEIYRQSAPAGYSEHQTGLAVDFSINGSKNMTNTGVWADNAKGYQWLKNNAHKYGYRQTYTKGNAQGVSQENWHWAYTGSDEAKRLLTPVGGKTNIPQGSATTPATTKTVQAPDLKTTNLQKPPTIPQTTTKQKSQTLVANNQPLANNDRGLAHAISGLSNDRQYG